MECLIDKSVNNHPKHYVNYHCLDKAIAPTWWRATASCGRYMPGFLHFLHYLHCFLIVLKGTLTVKTGWMNVNPIMLRCNAWLQALPINIAHTFYFRQGLKGNWRPGEHRPTSGRETEEGFGYSDRAGLQTMRVIWPLGLRFLDSVGWWRPSVKVCTRSGDRYNQEQRHSPPLRDPSLEGGLCMGFPRGKLALTLQRMGDWRGCFKSFRSIIFLWHEIN